MEIYYEGIRGNEGIIVYEDETFEYAKDELIEIAKKSGNKDFIEFVDYFFNSAPTGDKNSEINRDFADWYFSGNWIYREEEDYE